MTIEADEIQKILPHRYPFLLVDRVLEMSDTAVTAIKNVTANEMHFVGHFPEKKVMPGVLIVEALAQAGGVLLLSREEFKGKLAFMVGVDGFRFKRQVIPGDTLTLKVELKSIRGPFGVAAAKAYVGEEFCAGGDIKFAVGQ